MCIGYLTDRDGALAVQIVRDSDDRPLYEGTVYWHTQASSSTEYAAGDRRRRRVAPGHPRPAPSTARCSAWARTSRSSFSDAYVAPTTNRLGFGQLAVQHVGSIVEHLAAQ